MIIRKFKKTIVALFAVLAICGMTIYIPEASYKAAVNNDYEISPCYLYTQSIISSINISDGDAVCLTSVRGYSATATKITITQTLQRKSGNLWFDVWSWTNTTSNWYYDYVNYYYPLTKGTTYRVKSCIKVYSGSKYETIYSYSGETTY